MAADTIDPRSDAELMADSISHPEVFGAIFDRHAQALLQFFARRVETDEADGLTGEVFRIAFERRSTYEPSQPDARPWLYGIAANLVKTHRRSQTRRLRASLHMAMSSEQLQSTATETQETRLALPLLAEAIETLPTIEREALLLFALEDLAYGDIAAALGIPIGTVRSRINRARKRLRALMPVEKTHAR